MFDLNNCDFNPVQGFVKNGVKKFSDRKIWYPRQVSQLGLGHTTAQCTVHIEHIGRPWKSGEAIFSNKRAVSKYSPYTLLAAKNHNFSRVVPEPRKQ